MKLFALASFAFLFGPSCEQAAPAPAGAGGGADPTPAAATADCTANAAAAPRADDVRQHVDVGDAPVRGAADAAVTLVVFSDFQCPYCARAETTVTELLRLYPGRLRVVFKEHPLPMHDKARLAAKAALAAGDQGRFWEMHDSLFTRDCTLDRAGLEACATHLGLDLRRFDASLDDPRLEARVAADEAQGQTLSVTGTPTFFIDGRRIIGAQPIEQFEAIIDEELGHAR
jgi:protein-disulfide isomerase